MSKIFTREEAEKIGHEIGVDFSNYNLSEFTLGINIELEHGSVCQMTNVTDDDPIITGKIALAHLNEIPDYYTRLEKMESEAIKIFQD